MAWLNPFAFRPLPVTLWTTAVYLAIVVPLVCIQESVPRAPAESALPAGVSLAEAWADLGHLTQHFHPANSHANDDVRAFLLARIGQILDRNGASWTTQVDEGGGSSFSAAPDAPDTDAVVFDDRLANVTFSNAYRSGRRSALYFEGSNVYVYVRGTRDAAGPWWQLPADAAAAQAMQKQLVLVNAHFDAVSSSYGATDDGVGVVAGLQLLRHFSTPGRRPARGVVVLLNNAEEDYLLGATAFAQSALAPYVGTFVNLEGAGAGGRAVLFRATDGEVVAAYQAAPHPFGTVVASDGFAQGWIRSETDYRVWASVLGYRGLDVAFAKPRVRYHTTQDDRRHTSPDSVWHMLSGALAAAQGLSGGGAVGDRIAAQGAAAAAATDAVWFDLWGDRLVLFGLRGMFAWSVALLVAAPLVLALVGVGLRARDRDYLFCAAVALPEDGAAVVLGGWKGFFRFPVALLAGSAAVVAAALLLRKAQPFAMYGSLYVVIALMASLFYVVFWFVMRGADAVRPSAFHRTYALFWLFVLAWVLLVAVAVLENRDRVASGYIVVFWTTSTFLALLVSLLECFFLPTKTAYVAELAGADDGRPHVGSGGGGGDGDDGGDGDEGDHAAAAAEGDALIAPSPGEGVSAYADEEGGNGDAPTERSPLLRTAPTTSYTTRYARRSLSSLAAHRTLGAAADGGGADSNGDGDGGAFGREQAWSKSLPSWTWLVQFLLLGPFHLVLAGQLLLTLAEAVQQTGTDGSSLLTPYLLVGALVVLALAPLTPFVHRVHGGVAAALGAAGAGLLVYALAAFPFSAASPFKFSLRQTLSVDHGNTSVTISGHEAYVAEIVASLPSAAGRPYACAPASAFLAGILDCTFDGTGLEPVVAPDSVVLGDDEGNPYAHLVTVNATRTGRRRAVLAIDAANTRSCVLQLERPARSVAVRGAADQGRIDRRFDFDPAPPPADDDGSWAVGDLTLWRRDWTTPWVVDVEWEGGEEVEGVGEVEEDEDGDGDGDGQIEHGTVVCRWADVNTAGTVPAVDEAWKFAPAWSILTIRSTPALVQGSKVFSV